VAQAAMRDADAALVGVLAAALHNPVWTSSVLTPVNFAIILSGFLLLVAWRISPWISVVLMAAVTVIVQML